MALTRRAFLGQAAATGVALWTPGGWNAARAAALAADRSASPAGTTLESTIEIAGGAGYRHLRVGPGWPTVVRTELASLRPERVDRRRALAAVVQLTDVHVVDAQSPGRVEFLDGLGEPFTGAFRPQETLTTQVQASMVQRINEVGCGPVTGRPLDCAVSTGDNVDNQQHNELEWFMAVLNGGAVRADSGRPGEYEGVQAAEWDDARYWRPDGGAATGPYDSAGFPRVPALLAASIAPFRSPGLAVPWYSCYGNHDGLIQGNLPRSDAADALLTGDRKITDLPPGTGAGAFLAGMFANVEGIRSELAAGRMPHRSVTPDDGRRTVQREEWVRLHLDRGGRAGAPGHGFDRSHLGGGGLHYTFEVAPGVVGIVLDTGGYDSGSIGQRQVDWLEAELRKLHSRAFDAEGSPVRPGGTDQLVLLFSHFTIGTLTGSLSDPAAPDEKRWLGPELVSFLQRWPNIVGWVNGHTHTNEVRPVPDPSGRTNGFWEITTASHVDFPEHARIVEVVDNRDGTISLICTILEHAAPAAVDPSDTSVLGLAALSRELGANDLGVDPIRHLGGTDSLNVELGLPAPFDLAAAGIDGAAGRRSPPAEEDASDGDGDAGVATLVGGGAVVAVGAAAAGLLALRRRSDRAADGANSGGASS